MVYSPETDRPGNLRVTSVMSKENTRWGWVEWKVEPDNDGEIVLGLDGADYTMECCLDPLVAFRLGQALVRTARQSGKLRDLSDPDV